MDPRDGRDGASAGDGRATVRLGLIAAPGLAAEIAEQLAAELPPLLRDRVADGVAWSVPVRVDPRPDEERGGAIAMIDAARERLLREDWDLAVLLTDLPLRIGRRPVVADASATHGVGLVSLPALGAVAMRRRARDAIARLVDGLLGESLAARDGARETAGRRRRVTRLLTQLAAPVRPVATDDDDIDLRFVAAVVRGNLRLLAGMVRTNRPWRLIARLSRALAAALAAAAFALVTADIWRLADGLGWARMLALMLVSLAATVVSLIVAHELWERPAAGRAREQTVLFNVATALTVTLGVLWLYAALFVLALLASALMLDTDVLAREIGHAAGVRDHVHLSWFVSSLATVGGALGAGLESDVAVREAAYGYRAEGETVRDAAAGGG